MLTRNTLVRSIWIRTEEGKKIRNYVDDIFLCFPMLKEFEWTVSCNSILELLRYCQYRCRDLVLRGLSKVFRPCFFVDFLKLFLTTDVGLDSYVIESKCSPFEKKS